MPSPHHNHAFVDDTQRDANYNPSMLSTPAPSYDSAHPTSSHTLDPYGSVYDRTHPSDPSPFASVFDDDSAHAHGYASYPAGPPAAMPQPGVYEDTGYYGSGGTHLSSRHHFTEDIPLQQYAAKDGELNDHVYDAAISEGQNRRTKSRAKVRLGELGMFGADRKRIAWIVYIFTTIQVAFFIAEIVKDGILTGSPIMIKPQFNPMIGPSTQVMINMGARYVPCMHNVREIQGSNVSVLFLCPNATSNDQFCPLSDLCGFGGVPNPTFNNIDQSPTPNQWFRFITPIFMHAGLIHIGFNLLMQLTIAKEMEVAIGPIRFFLVYMSAGIFGFVLGGNFAAPALPSTGASGALFGIIALTLLDLFYSWKERKNPVKDLMFLLLDMVISFALGLLPGLDNFAHIGGFVMGLGLGIFVLHSPNSLRRRMGSGTPYSAVFPGEGSSQPFHKGLVGFFKGRKPLWWVWWIVRAVVLIAVVIFIVFLNNFYRAQHRCEWCKYLSCLEWICLIRPHCHSGPELTEMQPISNWCEIGTIRETGR